MHNRTEFKLVSGRIDQIADEVNESLDIGWRIHGTVIYNDDDEIYVQAMTREVVDDRSLIIWALTHGWEVEFDEPDFMWRWSRDSVRWSIPGYLQEGPKLNVEFRRALTDEMIVGKGKSKPLDVHDFVCAHCGDNIHIMSGIGGIEGKVKIHCAGIRQEDCLFKAEYTEGSRDEAENNGLKDLLELGHVKRR